MNIYQYMQLVGFLPLAALLFFLCFKQWKKLWESPQPISNSSGSLSEKREETQKDSIQFSRTHWNERAIMRQIVLVYLYVRAKENWTPAECWALSCVVVNNHYRKDAITHT